MWTRLSLKVKLTMLVVSLVTAASWTFGRFTFYGLLEMLDKAVGQGAVTAAQGFAELIDGQWLEQLNLDGGIIDLHHRRLEERFRRALEAGIIHRIDVIRFVDRVTIQHVLSLPDDGTPDHFQPGQREEIVADSLYTAREPGYHGVTLATPGAFMAGWVPLRDGDRIVGLLMVFINGDELQEVINEISIAVVAALFTFIIVAGVLAYKLSASFEKAAVTDGLMGIYNHKYFKQRLEGEVAKSRRYGQQTSIVLLDLDFFKRVNDTYGHATGDLVLKYLARWVTDSSRTTDVVARYGGEEVAIILPFTGLAGAQEFAERLRLKISEQVIRDPEEDAEFRVTVSVGVAQWEKGLGQLDLIKRADAALYQSKDAGRNRVTIYQDDLVPATEAAVGQS